MCLLIKIFRKKETLFTDSRSTWTTLGGEASGLHFKYKDGDGVRHNTTNSRSGKATESLKSLFTQVRLFLFYSYLDLFIYLFFYKVGIYFWFFVSEMLFSALLALGICLVPAYSNPSGTLHFTVERMWKYSIFAWYYWLVSFQIICPNVLFLCRASWQSFPSTVFQRGEENRGWCIHILQKRVSSSYNCSF